MHRTVSALALLLAVTQVAGCPKQSGSTRGGPHGGSGADALYVVGWGETLEEIASRHAVRGGWQKLAQINKLDDPNYIEDGQRLRMPRASVGTDEFPNYDAQRATNHRFDACATMPMGSAVATTVGGCASAACAQVDSIRQVCACEAGDKDAFYLFEAGQMQVSWPASIASADRDPTWEPMGTAVDFEVVGVQLGRAGDLPVIAVAHRVTNNDVGMSQWDLALLSDRSAPPVRLRVANYGDGTFVAGSRGTCQVLATEWERAFTPGRLGAGWHLTARVLRLDGGELRHVASQPMVGRRLYYNFEPGLQRRPGGLAVGTPLADLSHASTQELLIEPYTHYPYVGQQPSVIRTSSYNSAGELVIEHANGSYRFGPMQPTRLGDAETARLFPLGYSPTASLTGRAIRAGAFVRDYGEAGPVVWLKGPEAR